MKVVNGIIIGPSGVGKGYGLGQVLEEYFSTKVFVTGDWCRRHRSEMADQAVLIPDDEITNASFEELDALVRERKSEKRNFSFFIDAPRTVEQAKEIKRRLMVESSSEFVCFHLHAEPKTCIDRMTERALRHSRADDAKWETIRKRLGFYFGKEAPGFSQENPVYLPEGGVLNEIVPWAVSNTSYHRIDADNCLEDIRDQVRWSIAPKIFTPVSA